MGGFSYAVLYPLPSFGVLRQFLFIPLQSLAYCTVYEPRGFYAGVPPLLLPPNLVVVHAGSPVMDPPRSAHSYRRPKLPFWNGNDLSFKRPWDKRPRASVLEVQIGQRGGYCDPDRIRPPYGLQLLCAFPVAHLHVLAGIGDGEPRYLTAQSPGDGGGLFLASAFLAYT